MLLIEFTRRVDKSHGRFAAVDDSHALKFALHKAPDHLIVP
jgi:hypothetical protein